MAHNILVWIETFNGAGVSISYECLGEAKRIANGGAVTAAVFGQNAAAIAAEAISLGADKAIVCDDATLNDFRPEPYIAQLTKIAQDVKPDVVMAGASARGRDDELGRLGKYRKPAGEKRRVVRDRQQRLAQRREHHGIDRVRVDDSLHIRPRAGVGLHTRSGRTAHLSCAIMASSRRRRAWRRRCSWR